MGFHVLYGALADAPEEVAEALGAEFGFTFERRESHYAGEYWLARVGDTSVKIVSQLDSYGDPTEPDFVSYKTLVYVDGEQPIAELSAAVIKGSRLRKLRSTWR